MLIVCWDRSLSLLSSKTTLLSKLRHLLPKVRLQHDRSTLLSYNFWWRTREKNLLNCTIKLIIENFSKIVEIVRRKRKCSPWRVILETPISFFKRHSKIRILEITKNKFRLSLIAIVGTCFVEKEMKSKWYVIWIELISLDELISPIHGYLRAKVGIQFEVTFHSATPDKWSGIAVYSWREKLKLFEWWESLRMTSELRFWPNCFQERRLNKYLPWKLSKSSAGTYV